MTINYNVTGTERKRLADYIGGFLGCNKKYLGAPSFAYQVGYIEVSKDGAVTFDDRADSKEIETLLEELEGEGFHAEPAADDAEDAEPTEGLETAGNTELDGPDADDGAENSASGEEPEAATDAQQGETVGLTVAVPLDKVQVGNLTSLLDAKGGLIKKALGIEATPIEVTEDAVSFPWFQTMPEPEAAKAYTHFISALCGMSVTQKRVTAREKDVDNEKYAFRCFLLRLGFIGSEYKAERKILLKNLTGSSAFKSGARKAQDCLSCSHSFSEPGSEGGDILHCMECGGAVVEDNGHCENWN